MTTATKSTARVASGKLLWAGPLAGLIAALANLIVYFVSGPLAGELFIQMGPGGPVEPLTFAPVLVTSFIPALAAAALYAALGRFTARPTLIFVVISAVVLLLSYGGPVSLEVPASSKAVLAVMHTVAAVAIVGTLVTASSRP